MAVQNLKSNNFDKFISSNKLVAVDFYANWCGPCKMLSPIMETLSSKMNDVVFAKINVDEEQQLSRKFNIMSIPTVLIFKNNKLVNQFVGFRDERAIKEIISSS